MAEGTRYIFSFLSEAQVSVVGKHIHCSIDGNLQLLLRQGLHHNGSDRCTTAASAPAQLPLLLWGLEMVETEGVDFLYYCCSGSLHQGFLASSRLIFRASLATLAGLNLCRVSFQLTLETTICQELHTGVLRGKQLALLRDLRFLVEG